MSSTSERLEWHLLEGKAMEVLAMLLTVVIYTMIKFGMWRNSKGGDESTELFTSAAKQAVKDADSKLTLVPIIFVFLRFWGTLRFFQNVNSNEPGGSYVIELLQVISCDCHLRAHPSYRISAIQGRALPTPCCMWRERSACVTISSPCSAAAPCKSMKPTDPCSYVQ